MAKRPRMGRSLDALLGGAARERSSKSTDAHAVSEKSADSPKTSSSSNLSKSSGSSESSESLESLEATATGAGKVGYTPAGPADATKVDADVATTDDASPETSHKAEPATHDTSDAANESNARTGAGTSPATGSGTHQGAGTAKATAAVDKSGGTDRLRMIGLDQIRRGSYQPRRLFDPDLLQELADSIKAEGMIQPIIVRPFAGAFELVAGERRWRAAQLAGLGEIPAIVRDMHDQSVAAVALIENIQRKDLNPLEEAAAFERLCDEFGMTHKAVAESVGRSRASVTNLMRLLELHDEVKLMVDRGELEMGHARAILGAPRDRQHELARDVTKRGLTVRAVEKLVRDMVASDEPAPTRKVGPVSDPDIERLCQKLGETLGAPVSIQHKPDGRGKLEINYASVAELQGILAHIK